MKMTTMNKNEIIGTKIGENTPLEGRTREF